MVPSVVASSVCWSLQCLISTLTQRGGGGQFFRLTCSVVLWGGRKAANKYPWHVWGCSQCLRHTGFAPTHSVCAFLVYTIQVLGCFARNCLRQALGCMHFPGLSRSGSGTQVHLKGADAFGPSFCALPWSESLRWPGVWWAQSLQLITSLIPAARFSGCTTGALFRMLLADVDYPEPQEVLVSKEACLQFGR